MSIRKSSMSISTKTKSTQCLASLIKLSHKLLHPICKCALGENDYSGVRCGNHQFRVFQNRTALFCVSNYLCSRPYNQGNTKTTSTIPNSFVNDLSGGKTRSTNQIMDAKLPAKPQFTYSGGWFGGGEFVCWKLPLYLSVERKDAGSGETSSEYQCARVSDTRKYSVSSIVKGWPHYTHGFEISPRLCTRLFSCAKRNGISIVIE